MPLLHRRSYTRTDFRRLACRPRATPLGFEASICAGPRSSGPVIHLAQSRSPLRISCSSRVSLSRHRPPLSRLPSAHDVARSIFAGACIFRWSRSQSSARCRLPCSPGQSQMRSSCSSPSDPLLRLENKDSLRDACASRAARLATFSLLAQQARSRPWPDLLASRSSSPCGVSSSESLPPAHLSVTRAYGVAARIFCFRALRCRGSWHLCRCSLFPIRDVSRFLGHFAMVEDRARPSAHLSMREIVQRPCTPRRSCLRSCSPAFQRSSPPTDMFASRRSRLLA